MEKTANAGAKTANAGRTQVRIKVGLWSLLLGCDCGSTARSRRHQLSTRCRSGRNPYCGQAWAVVENRALLEGKQALFMGKRCFVWRCGALGAPWPCGSSSSPPLSYTSSRPGPPPVPALTVTGGVGGGPVAGPDGRRGAAPGRGPAGGAGEAGGLGAAGGGEGGGPPPPPPPPPPAEAPLDLIAFIGLSGVHICRREGG